jgi:hypothetical protein
MTTKTAYLWIVSWTCGDGPLVTADLFFSSPAKFRELYRCANVDQQQLVAVQVPADFDHLDFIPNDY